MGEDEEDLEEDELWQPPPQGGTAWSRPRQGHWVNDEDHTPERRFDSERQLFRHEWLLQSPKREREALRQAAKRKKQAEKEAKRRA